MKSSKITNWKCCLFISYMNLKITKFLKYFSYFLHFIIFYISNLHCNVKLNLFKVCLRLNLDKGNSGKAPKTLFENLNPYKAACWGWSVSVSVSGATVVAVACCQLFLVRCPAVNCQTAAVEKGRRTQNKRRKAIERVLQGGDDKKFHFMRTGAYVQLSRKMQTVVQIQMEVQIQMQIEMHIQMQIQIQLQVCSTLSMCCKYL